MEFLVQFDVNIPSGVPPSEVDDRLKADTRASAGLADQAFLSVFVSCHQRPERRSSSACIELTATLSSTSACTRCRWHLGCTSRSPSWNPTGTIPM